MSGMGKKEMGMGLSLLIQTYYASTSSQKEEYKVHEKFIANCYYCQQMATKMTQPPFHPTPNERTGSF